MEKTKITTFNIFEISNKLLKECPEFFRFLKENGAYDKWVRNRCNYMLKAHHNEFDFFHKEDLKLSPEYFLSSYYTSFSWDETPEDFRFWENLSAKWYNEYSSFWKNRSRN